MCMRGCVQYYRFKLLKMFAILAIYFSFIAHKIYTCFSYLHSKKKKLCAIDDRLQRPHYLSSVDRERKISSRRQRTDIGKYSFVNRTIQHWNQLPAEVLGILPCKPITFKKRARKLIIELN